MSFSGLKIISFESRYAEEMARLIRTQGGEPFVAPSMREAPLESNEEAFLFAERLFAGEVDMMILLTGVGTRVLDQVLSSRYPPGRFPEALRRITVVARGPKPAAVLREWNVPIAINVREPNTWREILDATRDRSEKRIAVQEYGRSNPELIEGLRARGAEVIPVRIYRWDLPLDLAPLKEAVRRIAGGQADVVMFTTGTQVAHLFRVAAEAGLEEAVRQRLREAVVASIGPTTSEMLEEYGILADIVPGHPRMGFLVKETADRAPAVLAEKRKA